MQRSHSYQVRHDHNIPHPTSPTICGNGQSTWNKGFVSAEFGDKTFFVSAILAARHSWKPVWMGSVSALWVQTILCAATGYFLGAGNLSGNGGKSGSGGPAGGLGWWKIGEVAAGGLLIFLGVKNLMDAFNPDDGDTDEELEPLGQRLLKDTLVVETPGSGSLRDEALEDRYVEHGSEAAQKMRAEEIGGAKGVAFVGAGPFTPAKVERNVKGVVKGVVKVSDEDKEKEKEIKGLLSRSTSVGEDHRDEKPDIVDLKPGPVPFGSFDAGKINQPPIHRESIRIRIRETLRARKRLLGNRSKSGIISSSGNRRKSMLQAEQLLRDKRLLADFDEVDSDLDSDDEDLTPSTLGGSRGLNFGLGRGLGLGLDSHLLSKSNDGFLSGASSHSDTQAHTHSHSHSCSNAGAHEYEEGKDRSDEEEGKGGRNERRKTGERKVLFSGEEEGGKLTMTRISEVNKIDKIYSKGKKGHTTNMTVFLTTFWAILIAEIGDRSMFGTAALATTQNAFGVAVGACMAHAILSFTAVSCAEFLTAWISDRLLSALAGVLFIAFGVLSLLNAFLSENNPLAKLTAYLLGFSS